MESKRRKLSEALAKVPHGTFKKIVKLIGDDEGSRLPDGYGWRSAQNVLAPSKDVYVLLDAAVTDRTEPVQFACADIQKLLHYACKASQSFKQRLQRCQALKAVFYADEATGGNVLQTSSSKKIFFTYVGFQGLGSQLDEVSWLPFAAIPARDLACVQGGFSAVMAIMLRFFAEQRQTGILIGHRNLPLSLLAYVGDFDSIARSMGSLGAAAFKPCCLCDNVLQKQSDVPARNTFFVGIGCSDVARFRQVEQNDLDAQFDSMLASSTSEASRKKNETLLGFHLDKHGLRARRVSRALLPLSKLVYDSQHNYYANGVASAECLLLQHFLEAEHGITIKDIQASVKEVDWFTWVDNYKSRSGRGYLFNPKFWDGDHYKGGASALYFLLPLYLHILHKLGFLDGTPQLASFDALFAAPWPIHVISFVL